MDFQLENFHRNISDDELISDLKKLDESLKAHGGTLNFRTYATTGRFSASTIAERFGTWNNALAAAGLSTNQEKNIGVDALFENLRTVWVTKGKQPVFRDMAAPPSQYGGQLYAARFGGWRNALHKFVTLVNSDAWVATSDGEPDCEQMPDTRNLEARKRTGRSISLRMRFRILLRDNFKCQSCGASPASDPGVELQVDHILPWSRGGETEDNNLETKCRRCNLGKGNEYNQ
jgi:hypothetical protein